MPLPLMLALVVIFGSVAALTGGVLLLVLGGGEAPEQRRLRDVVGRRAEGAGKTPMVLADLPAQLKGRLASLVPRSPKDMSRLQKRLAKAGIHGLGPALTYVFAELLLPVIFGGAALYFLGLRSGIVPALIAGAVGYLIPGLVVQQAIKRRKKQISNGLPDALDLFIVCLEAGSALDQAIVKATDELGLAYPALAEELRMITSEVRAGKPRTEAFKNFAARTQVDDVRALVAMLVQTDRFGTSVAQALRTHAEVSRTKRRQRAEERAAKVGVKLVFPLVFLLFPAFYVVTLGPAVIQFVRVFFGQVMAR
jgi:tight adherence protein C